MFGVIIVVDPVIESVTGVLDIVTATDKFVTGECIFFHVKRTEVESIDYLPVEKIRMEPFVSKTGKSAHFKSGIVEPGGIFQRKFFTAGAIFDRAHPAVESGLFFQKIVGGVNHGAFDVADEINFSAFDDDSIAVIFQILSRKCGFEN